MCAPRCLVCTGRNTLLYTHGSGDYEEVTALSGSEIILGPKQPGVRPNLGSESIRDLASSLAIEFAYLVLRADGIHSAHRYRCSFPEEGATHLCILSLRYQRERVRHCLDSCVSTADSITTYYSRLPFIHPSLASNEFGPVHSIRTDTRRVPLVHLNTWTSY